MCHLSLPYQCKENEKISSVRTKTTCSIESTYLPRSALKIYQLREKNYSFPPPLPLFSLRTGDGEKPNDILFILSEWLS